MGELVSGVIGFAVAMVLWWLNSRTELEKTRLQINAQAELTRLQIDAQTEQARFPDLVRAASEFAAEMRRQVKLHNSHVESGGERMVDEWNDRNGENAPRDAPAAELAASTLEFFADDALVGAARAWLEAFYVVWFDKESPDMETRAAQYETLRDADKAYTEQVRRSLKVSSPAVS